MTQLLECRQQRPFRRPALLVLVERRCLPAKLLAIFRVVEAEAVEEILAADQRHVPQAGNALRIGFDWQLVDEFLKHSRADAIPGEMLLERVIGGKLDRRTDEQDRLPLTPGKREIVNGSDA